MASTGQGFGSTRGMWVVVLLAVPAASCEEHVASHGKPTAVTRAALDINIYDCADLQDMEDDLEGSYVLANDIDCTGFNPGDGKGFRPVGTTNNEFTGQFNGNGHVIENLRIARPSLDKVGLFGNAYAATIQRVGLVDVDIEGHYAVGGVVGRTEETVVNQVYVTGTVTGDTWVGGLVGEVLETFEDGRIEDS